MEDTEIKIRLPLKAYEEINNIILANDIYEDYNDFITHSIINSLESYKKKF